MEYFAFLFLIKFSCFFLHLGAYLNRLWRLLSAVMTCCLHTTIVKCIHSSYFVYVAIGNRTWHKKGKLTQVMSTILYTIDQYGPNVLYYVNKKYSPAIIIFTNFKRCRRHFYDYFFIGIITVFIWAFIRYFISIGRYIQYLCVYLLSVAIIFTPVEKKNLTNFKCRTIKSATQIKIHFHHIS